MTTSPLLSPDGWSLEKSVESDIDRLMTWFSDKDATVMWGGPGFRYPYTRHSFVEDMCWGHMASFSLRSPSDGLVAFGQLYERIGRINLARLVARPEFRGQGVGKRLVRMLMTASQSLFSCAEFSLFVYRGNTPALECYKSLGFTVTNYPDKSPHGDVCYYLTRPVAAVET